MSSLKKNTIYLYLLTGSNYLFSLATIPFLTRVLGPETFGDLGFAMAIGVYFNLIFDLGFILSGTKQVADNTNDKYELSKILTSITTIKLIILFFCSFAILIISSYVTELQNNIKLILLFMVVSFMNSLLPDYMYRGLEDMKILTIRGVITRGIFTFLVFCFLRRPSQVIMVPIFHIIGGIVVLIIVYWDLVKRLNIKFCKIDLTHLKVTFKRSIPFFLSRIASSIYNVTNTVILGLLYPGNAVVGYYSSAEKFKSITAQGCSPIADSFYPYMIRTKDFIKLIKTTIILEIPIIIGCVLLFIWAKPICILVFGEVYSDSYLLLRWIIPMMALTLPTYMFGFPALTPLNKANWANISVEIATINQIIGLVILFSINSISAISLCILTLISESLVFIIRVIGFSKGLKIYRRLTHSNNSKTFGSAV